MCTTTRLLEKKGDRVTRTRNNDQVFDVNTWLQNQLSGCLDSDGKYNGIIKIILNAYMFTSLSIASRVIWLKVTLRRP